MIFMKKIVIPSAGGYEKLCLKEGAEPVPQDNEVLIDVHFAGVNYADVLIRLGIYESAKKYVGWPITPGFEVSGVISEVGKAVKGFKTGEEVIGFTLFNGYSSKLALDPTQLIKLPKSFSLEQGAAFPAVFMTAYHALFQIFHLPPEALLLVHSAAGGVGSALLSLAKIRGFRTIGVVGRTNKIDYAKSLGAEEVYDKSDPHFAFRNILDDYPEGFDAVFDANGYTTLKFSYEALRPTGKLVSYGSHSLLEKTGGRINYIKAAWGLINTPRFNPLDMITDNKSIAGFNLSFLFEHELLRKEGVEGLSELIHEGTLPPPKVTVFPVEKAAEAHKFIESGNSVGKIVLKFK
jgi:synaptic vesicle membrane protein VAT-1